MNKTYMKLRVLLLVLSSIGCILYIAAFAIPKWSKHKDGNDGLWQMCYVNGGTETCAVWPGHLKTSEHKIAQVLGCFGLAFFILFVVFGALTIFWTNHWKKARAIKYSTVVLAILTVIFVITCVLIYKDDKESRDHTISIGWTLALVGGIIAAVAAPFYLIDACRTVAPQKPDKERLFNKFGNIPPVPTTGKFPDREPDTFGRSNGGRPPLLSELRKQHTTFIHPPPKPANKNLTKKEIQSFPLPPSKTKLNLFDKSEIEDHPSPVPPAVIYHDKVHSVPPTNIANQDDHDIHSTRDTNSESNTVENEVEETATEHSVFKFHKSKTIHKKGKTIFKIQNEGAKLPPVMMVMPGVDENSEENIDRTKSRLTMNSSKSEFEQEQARRKFAPYFMDVVEIKGPEKNEDDKNHKTNDKTKKKTTSEKNKEKLLKGRVKEMSFVYGESKGQIDVQEKQKPKKKIKKKSNRPESNISANLQTCVNTYGKEMNLCSQDGVTIHNDIGEEEI